MNMSKTKWSVVALSTAYSVAANAAAQDVNVGALLPRSELLKVGTHHYLGL